MHVYSEVTSTEFTGTYSKVSVHRNSAPPAQHLLQSKLWLTLTVVQIGAIVSFNHGLNLELYLYQYVLQCTQHFIMSQTLVALKLPNSADGRNVHSHRLLQVKGA